MKVTTAREWRELAARRRAAMTLQEAFKQGAFEKAMRGEALDAEEAEALREALAPVFASLREVVARAVASVVRAAGCADVARLATARALGGLRPLARGEDSDLGLIG